MTAAVPLPACFDLFRAFAARIELAEIVAATAWEQKTIKLFGKERQIPRLTKWYGSAPYTYSGAVNAPEPMPSWLDSLRVEVERAIGGGAGRAAGSGAGRAAGSRAGRAIGARFNSALLNYYRDGRDSVAWHADDEPELGDRPTIASLSFGAPRTFAIRAAAVIRAYPSGGPWRLALGHGDLLVMRGESQRDYVHSVPKTAAPVGPRVNVTFRWVAA